MSDSLTFFISPPLFSSAFVRSGFLSVRAPPLAPKPVCSRRPHRNRHVLCKCSRSAPSTSFTPWTSQSSSALDYNKDADDNIARYIDLRTMKVVLPEEAHLSPAPDLKTGFTSLNMYSLFTDVQRSQLLRNLLFSEDTLPLSDVQKGVVQALLSSRSVLYASATPEEKQAIFIDIALRSRAMKECIVYCALTRRAAEAMFSTVCAQLGPERRNEVLLDVGDGAPRRFDSDAPPTEHIRIVITSPSVLRAAALDNSANTWYLSASVLFLDNVNETSLVQLEEVLLALPHRLLVCIFSSNISRSAQELLPIWIETIQNPTSIVSSSLSPLLSRIERPQNLPLLRTFAYNAALHQSPVQVSLTILKDLLQQEIDSPDGEFIPNFSESFLHGINLIGAEDPAQYLFSDIDEANYADVASLVIADAKHIEGVLRSKAKRRSRSRKKERTPASRAAARRRRDAAYAESVLLPAIVLVNGHKEAISAAHAIANTLEGASSLMWDEDTLDHVEHVVNSFMEMKKDDLTPQDNQVLKLIRIGIGVVHDMYTPSIRVLVEEMFRSNLIPLVIFDTHLGTEEMSALHSAKSVLVESSCLAICDDPSKGLVSAAAAAAFAGRIGKDDVGNLVVLWYDEDVTDEIAGREMASTLLAPVLTGYWNEPQPQNMKPYLSSGRGFSPPFRLPNSREVQSGTQSIISSTYETVLRSLRRFGPDGYGLIFEYTLSSFKGWLKRAAIHATLEKVSLEKKAIDDRLEKEDWDSVADFERKTAKVNEVRRLLKAMKSRFDAVCERRVMEELKSSTAGRIIGVKCRVADVLAFSVEPTILGGATNDNGDHDAGGSTAPTVADYAKADATETLQITKGDDKHASKLSAAVFVCVIDQESDGKRLLRISSRYLAVCIFGDGVWSLVPVSDVEALADDDVDVVSNVDLLTPPHPATFDIDPVSQWAKCVPIDEAEQAAVHRVSDELITRMTSEQRPKVSRQNIPEFEAQQQHMKTMEEAHRQSPWFGRDKELAELRRLRRRGVELGDEVNTLQRRKDQSEEEMDERHNDFRSVQSAILAVLEDCHAVGFVPDGVMEMTPIGAIASVLPCDFPLFASACLCIIDDAENLSVGEFTAYVAVLVSAGRIWAREPGDENGYEIDDNEPIDLSSVGNEYGRMEESSSDEDDEGRASDGDTDAEEKVETQQLGQFIPPSVSGMVVEVKKALHHLHRRHLGECQAAEKVWVPEIVPTVLDTRLGMAVKNFAEGGRWPDVCEALGDEGGYAVRELRRICSVLQLIERDEENGEFSPGLKQAARRSLEALNRWPVRDHDVIAELLENGVVERVWSGNTYDRWWRTMREALKNEPTEQKRVEKLRNVVENGAGGGKNAEDSFESAEAEIMESL